MAAKQPLPRASSAGSVPVSAWERSLLQGTRSDERTLGEERNEADLRSAGPRRRGEPAGSGSQAGSRSACRGGERAGARSQQPSPLGARAWSSFAVGAFYKAGPLAFDSDRPFDSPCDLPEEVIMTVIRVRKVADGEELVVGEDTNEAHRELGPSVIPARRASSAVTRRSRIHSRTLRDASVTTRRPGSSGGALRTTPALERPVRPGSMA